MRCDGVVFVLKVERQRRLERIKQKQSQLQELILQVTALLAASAPAPTWCPGQLTRRTEGGRARSHGSPVLS